MINFYVISIFPEIINTYGKYGILSKAIKQNIVKLNTINPRDFYEKVDDVAYGGFPGMVLKPEPIYEAYKHVLSLTKTKPFVIKPEPWGKKLDQNLVKDIAMHEHILIICGRYEGIDERVNRIVDLEISLGDFILSGGEVVALSIIDAVSRLLEGVLSDENSLKEDSFTNKWLGYPVYTRPECYEGMCVPWVLKTGDHKLIKLWSLYERISLTLKKRPDIIPKHLTDLEYDIITYIECNLSFEEIAFWKGIL